MDPVRGTIQGLAACDRLTIVAGGESVTGGFSMPQIKEDNMDRTTGDIEPTAGQIRTIEAIANTLLDLSQRANANHLEARAILGRLIGDEPARQVPETSAIDAPGVLNALHNRTEDLANELQETQTILSRISEQC